MRGLKRFFARLASVATRGRDEARLREEIDEHVALQTEENLRAGMARGEARRQARLKFGAVEAMKEDYRGERGVVFLETLAQDARYSLRVLRKSRSFAAVAIVTLALGIGANAVVFAMLNGLILRPLDLPGAESLYLIERGSDHFPAQSYPDYVDLRDRNRTFEEIAACNVSRAGLDTGDSVSGALVYEASGNYFDMLRIQPFLGRLLHASDERGPNSAPYVVLSYAYWHSHFQDDRTVVGRTVRLNKHPFTVVGVTPPDFHGTILFMFPDVFVPIVNQEQLDGADYLSARGNRWVFMTVGRLKAGGSVVDATADLNSIGAYLAATYPEDHDKVNFALARPSLYGDYITRPTQAFLTGLLALAALILLAACANLGSLFAARAEDRSREVALRLALGAGRARVMRQLLTEALLIAVIGGALGLWGSTVLLQALSAWRPFPWFPINIPVHADARVYVLALVLTLVSGLLFGVAPVRQVLRTSPYGVIKSGSASTTGRRLTLRDALIAVQIAICAVLVTSSLVAVRGLVRSLHSSFGFDPRDSMLVEADLQEAGYRGDELPAMHKRMIEAIETIPGVTTVATIDQAPISNGRPNTAMVFKVETIDLRHSNAVGESFIFNVSPAYFHAAGTALLAGRDFTWADDKGTPHVAVVNEEFAREVFGSVGAAVGRYYKMPDGGRIQVVGVAENGKYSSLTEDPQLAMFFPIRQSPPNTVMVVVRSKNDSQQLAAAARSKVRELDAGLPVLIQTRIEAMAFVLFPARMATVSLGVLGMMGAMLSVTGIFGIAAYSVSRRKRELGIRIALGAQRRELLGAALGRALRLLAGGSAAGLVLGILASRVLGAIVYQATPRDPWVLTGVVAGMALLGVVATWIPAQRALGIDPVALLREE